MEFLKPWFAESSDTFVDELHHEVGDGHPLFNVPVATLARRRDRDDVLFSILDESNRVAVVHLTWSNEGKPHWPITQFFDDFHSWVETGMKSDHAEFSA